MRKLTSYFIVFVIVLIGVFDLIAIQKAGTQATISQIVIEWSYKYPVFTFLIGFTFGHLFWRLRDNSRTKNLGRDSDDSSSS